MLFFLLDAIAFFKKRDDRGMIAYLETKNMCRKKNSKTTINLEQQQDASPPILRLTSVRIVIAALLQRTRGCVQYQFN
jgi:hypothetical protein